MNAKTTIDWLRFRTQAEPMEGLEALRGLYGSEGKRLRLHHLQRGADGFQQGSAVCLDDMALGRVDFGGASQRGWVRWNLTGRGCQWVKEWGAIEDVEALDAAQAKRLDIALTTWHGEVSDERFVAAHAAGRFVCGGRPPDMQTIESTNPRAGRTRQVGQRDSDKLVRGYEKGFEMASKLGALGAEMTHIDGCRIEDIYRVEVELKSKNQAVPWDVIGRRDEYFAGSYPFCAELLPGIEPDILMRRPERAPQSDLLAALANCRVQYGATLFTALQAMDGDFMRVWDLVVGDHHNPALLAAGVMLVDHG